jgi:hypothetical protein
MRIHGRPNVHQVCQGRCLLSRADYDQDGQVPHDLMPDGRPVVRGGQD